MKSPEHTADSVQTELITASGELAAEAMPLREPGVDQDILTPYEEQMGSMETFDHRSLTEAQVRILGAQGLGGASIERRVARSNDHDIYIALLGQQGASSDLSPEQRRASHEAYRTGRAQVGEVLAGNRRRREEEAGRAKINEYGAIIRTTPLPASYQAALERAHRQRHST